MDISNMLEVQVNEMKEEMNIKENVGHNVTPKDKTFSNITDTRSVPISDEESSFYELMFGSDIASVRYRRLHCTACDVHIGSAPSQAYNMVEHPVLLTLLCLKCHNFYGDGKFEQGDDATDMFCRWCANGGNLYCCSYCSNTFCYKCIRRNFSSLVRKKIEADEQWKCFVCNPCDLYSARAVCWALLHHVQTVTRILRNEKNMSRDEIEEKMNLDESQCCPHREARYKRKGKRRIESNSEDEEYIPETNGLSMHIKQRKQVRRIKPSQHRNNNGTFARQLHSYAAPIPIRPRPTPSVPSLKQTESLFSHESLMINCEQTNNKQPSEGIIVTPPNVINSDDVSLPRYDFQSNVYHTSILNHAAASTTYVRPRTMSPTTRQIILPPLSQTQNFYQSAQSLQPSPNTMVSIPNSTNTTSGPSRFILPKSTKNMTVTPNVIELDSDSDDEPRVVAQHYNENKDVDVVDISSNKIIPVALVSKENSDDVREKQPLLSLREMCTSLEKRSFSDMMLPYSQDLDELLGNLKEKVYSFFHLPDNDNAVKNIELIAQKKIMRFYKNMRDMVLQVTHINDRVMREYNKWERSRKTETALLSTEQKTISEENEIPLDMICVNDSDTESDYEESDCQIMEPSNLIKDNNIIKDLFFRKDKVHRGVGDNSILSDDKAIQVYDVVLRDYEKCISHSLLTKADYGPKTSDSVLESKTTPIPDENFGKYEEQYIFYLQQIEDHGIETEDMKGLINSDEISLKESIETTDSSSISELLNSSVASTDLSKNCNQEKSSENCVNLIINNEANVSTSVMKINDKKNMQIVDSVSDIEVEEMNIDANSEENDSEIEVTRESMV